MRRIISLLISITILDLTIFTSINAQNYSVSEATKYPKTAVNYFQRSDNIPKNIQVSRNFFPNSIGDFWEFIEDDTTTLFSQFLYLKFSISREVLNDTLMSNGLTYKKVKWQNEANSVNYLPKYEFLRVDSIGNVIIFYESSDHLLFDFTLNMNQTYPAHLPNYYWKVIDKYTVIGFGDTLQAIDFALYNQNNSKTEVYTIVENFGIIFYQKDLQNSSMHFGNFWGAVIDEQEYGTLIVKKQTVDWKEFYPLHIGNYWVYEGFSGSIPIINSVRIIGDTVMPDNNYYYVVKEIDHTFGYTSLSLQRLDSLGRIFHWEPWNNSAKQYFEFSNIVGDTLKSKFDGFIYRLNNKYINNITGLFELNYLLYPDVINAQDHYALGLGLYQTTGEMNLLECTGAFINGEIIWGDTTISSIEENNLQNSREFLLYPCYPNPFNPSTTIKFYINQSSYTTIKVSSVLGKEIKLLLEENLPAGEHNVQWNGKDNEGSTLPSGIYFIQMKADEYQQTIKTVLLK
ncbi:MAG TPA: FlgD immunoglobulin-like domain containing protein [Ignavibacteriaceae bacterium]|nr:FlgD immunoglobulin-like domain containing protein [Ignavibacteriaceae bacterium]